MSEARHIFSVLVENRSGVLARIAGLFSGRNFNIDSLSVAETEDPTVSRMTIATYGDEQIIEQIEKHLNKLIDVIKVRDLTEVSHVEREMILIQVNANPAQRSEILHIVEIFRARTIDVKPTTITIEVTGDDEKLQAVIDLLRHYGIRDFVRTGKVAIMRGPM